MKCRVGFPSATITVVSIKIRFPESRHATVFRVGEQHGRAAAKATVGQPFSVEGWAFKDGVGLQSVEVLLDGKVVGKADYGQPSPGTAAYWKLSNDPNHPNVGFRANVDTASISPGRHWLGLRLHGADGSVEDWVEQPVVIRAGP